MNTDKLKRTIGLFSATSIGLGAMLGAGIFVFPGLAGGNAGFAAIISFFIGGIIALFTAACTAELATAMPRSGGGYFFISRSFGTFGGTLVGIAQWMGLIFACGFYLVSFGEYALGFLRELDITWTDSTKIFSFSFSLILLAVNILGTKKVGHFQNLMVISLSIILVLIFTYGLIDFLGIEDKPVAFSELAPEGPRSIFTTTALIFTSYLGFVQIANIGAEIKEPRKNLPRSLIGSVLIAMSLYLFIMVICTITLPQEELNKFGETATIEVARLMLGKWGAIVILFAGVLAALSSANASMISASRGVFALGKDNLINQSATKINKRFGTPHVALILVAVPVAIMLFRNRLELFAEVASSLHLIIYAGICLSVLKFRATNPVWYVPAFRVPAAKAIAGIGAASCLTLLCFMQRDSLLISLGILLLATAYYFLFVRKREIKLHTPFPSHLDSDLIHPAVLIPVDITQEKKDLPKVLLEVLPIGKLLLLGFQETPEQSEPEQSEEEFSEEGEDKLKNILNQLEKAKMNFDSKLLFSNKIASQMKQLIEEEEFQYILTLKPLSNLNQLIVPIFDASQVNAALSTMIYSLQSGNPMTIKVCILKESDGDDANEIPLKQAVMNQFNRVNVNVDDYEVHQKENGASLHFLKKISKNTDLIIWSEAAPSQLDFFMRIIMEKEEGHIAAPVLMILRRTKS